MQIETKRLRVRTFKSEDWKDLQEYISQQSVMKYEREWDSSDSSCQEDTKYFFSEGNTMWAVELKETGKMIGHVYFGQVQPKDFMEWSIGYIFFNPIFYGNGYATEAAKLSFNTVLMNLWYIGYLQNAILTIHLHGNY